MNSLSPNAARSDNGSVPGLAQDTVPDTTHTDDQVRSGIEVPTNTQTPLFSIDMGALGVEEKRSAQVSIESAFLPGSNNCKINGGTFSIVKSSGGLNNTADLENSGHTSTIPGSRHGPGLINDSGTPEVSFYQKHVQVLQKDGKAWVEIKGGNFKDISQPHGGTWIAQGADIGMCKKAKDLPFIQDGVGAPSSVSDGDDA